MRFILVIGLIFTQYIAFGQIDRKRVFDALSSSSKEEITKEVNVLKSMKESADQKAFKGALLMKLAQFQSTPKDKLELFKTGKNLLEQEITHSDSNVEYYVLRLMIQENAPKILKYNTNMSADSEKIISGFSKLKEATKVAVKEYAKVSKYLNDLK